MCLPSPTSKWVPLGTNIAIEHMVPQLLNIRSLSFFKNSLFKTILSVKAYYTGITEKYYLHYSLNIFTKHIY